MAGQECPDCGEQARARHTGHDEVGRVVRQRVCPEGHKFSTLEVPIPLSFFRVAVLNRRQRPSKSGRRYYRPRNPVILRATVAELTRRRVSARVVSP